MIDKIARLMLCSAVISVTALAAPMAANAAGRHHSHRLRAVTHASNSTGSSAGKGAETALTGTELTSASNAALAAVPGATVSSATIEADGSSTAKFEVVLTKADGTRTKVVEDSAFAVLSSTATGCR